jgi:hypothetical protein
MATLECRHQRAMALHQLGRCEQATTELMRTWMLWRKHHGPADTTILRGIATLLHDCRAPDDIASIWLRTQLLAMPASIDTGVPYALAAGSTWARTQAHRAVCTRDRTAPTDPAHVVVAPPAPQPGTNPGPCEHTHRPGPLPASRRDRPDGHDPTA